MRRCAADRVDRLLPPRTGWIGSRPLKTIVCELVFAEPWLLRPREPRYVMRSFIKGCLAMTGHSAKKDTISWKWLFQEMAPNQVTWGTHFCLSILSQFCKHNWQICSNYLPPSSLRPQAGPRLAQTNGFALDKCWSNLKVDNSKDVPWHWRNFYENIDAFNSLLVPVYTAYKPPQKRRQSAF
jgi:hypothetical protein